MTELDKLGDKLKGRIAAFEVSKQKVETERQGIGSDLRVIWKAFEDAKKSKTPIVVNGSKSKTEYAAFLGKDMRYCQYLVKDGSRKRTDEQKEKEKANRSVRVITLKPGILVSIDGRKFEVVDWNLAATDKSKVPVCDLTLKYAEDQREEQPAKIPAAEKKNHLRHIPKPGFAGMVNKLCLCGETALNKDNTAKGKRYPATCEKCIALANLTPEEKSKSTKIPATTKNPKLNRAAKLDRVQTIGDLNRLKLTAIGYESSAGWSSQQHEVWLKQLKSMVGDGIHHQALVSQRIKAEKYFITHKRREERLDQIEAEGTEMSAQAKAVAAVVNGTDVTKKCDEEAL